MVSLVVLVLYVSAGTELITKMLLSFIFDSVNLRSESSTNGAINEGLETTFEGFSRQRRKGVEFRGVTFDCGKQSLSIIVLE
jgi:hypothetical protein